MPAVPRGASDEKTARTPFVNANLTPSHGGRIPPYVRVYAIIFVYSSVAILSKVLLSLTKIFLATSTARERQAFCY